MLLIFEMLLFQLHGPMPILGFDRLNQRMGLRMGLLLPPSVEPVETNGGMGCHHEVVGSTLILGFDKAQGKTLFSLRMGLRIGYCLCKVGE